MTAPTPTKVRGFFATVALFRAKVFLSWDFVAAMVAAVAAYLLVPDDRVNTVLGQLAGAGIAVATALAGVVIAALAIVVAFLDPQFTALIDRATRTRHGGMEGQLFPFWFVTGLAVATLLLSLGIVGFVSDAPALTARILLSVLTLSLVWTVLGLFNLVSYLHALGVSRALLIRQRTNADSRQERAQERTSADDQ